MIELKNPDLLDTATILRGGHGGSTDLLCARELLGMLITGKPDVVDHPCITAAQTCLIPLNDSVAWRDDAHRTAIMRRLIRVIINCSPRDDAADKRIALALADYAVRVCAAESLDAAGLAEIAAGLRALSPIVDADTAAAAARAAAEAAAEAAERASSTNPADIERHALAFAKITAREYDVTI